jgi:hypothetical protein
METEKGGEKREEEGIEGRECRREGKGTKKNKVKNKEGGGKIKRKK